MMDLQLIVTICLTSFSTFKLTHAQMIEPLPQINEYYASLIQPDAQQQNDQQAEGAVNVNFSPNNLGYFRFENRDVSPAEPYVQTLPIDGDIAPQEHGGEFVVPQALGLRMNPKQSQSFNVGYSVKFGGLPPALRQIPKQQQFFTDSDIITGRNKEEVMKPGDVINPVNEEFISASYNDNNNYKKHKIFTNKAKYHKSTPSSFDSTKISTYHDVSSETKVKMQPFEPDYAYSRKVNSSPWRILSPGVEIYKSKPLTTIPSEPIEDSKRFDHAKALGRSIGFDYSNVVDPKPYNYEPEETVNTKPEENRKYNNYIPPNENQETSKDLSPLTLTTNPNVYPPFPPSHHLNVDFSKTQQDGAGEYDNMATAEEEDMSYFPENYRNGFKTVLRSESQQNFDANSRYNSPPSLNVDFPQDGAKNTEEAENSNTFPPSNYNSNVGTFGSTSEMVDTRFLEQDYKPNVPTFKQKQLYRPFPVEHMVNHPPMQNYIKTRAPVYSVTENPQEDNTQHFSQLIYNYNKLPGRNTYYIPQNHRFYSGIKRFRPTSFRYSKEPKKYARPHGRNKVQSRIH